MPEELLERRHDLAVLARVLDDAAAGSATCVLVEGPAGIGKSALLARTVDLASTRGVRALAARGGELERGLPYAVVRQLFERRLALLDDDEREHVLAGAASLAERALGHGHSVAPTAEPSGATLHGLYWLAVNLAAIGPLALVVDDAHWADSASVQFLAYLARRLEGLNVAMVVALRDGDPNAWNPALAALRTDPSPLVLNPAPLSARAVGRVLARMWKSAPSPQVVAAVYEVTGGNPFLVRELASELADDPSSDSCVTADRVRSFGPPGVARSIAARAAALGPQAPALLRATAVLGERAELGTVAAVAGVDSAAAAASGGDLVRAGLLADGWPFTFAHPILRSAVYDEMPAPERSVLHARAAQTLHATGAGPEVVASQLILTPADGSEATTDTLRAAAGVAIDRGAPESAAAYLRRALAEPLPDQVRVAVLRDLAAVETVLQEPSAVAHLEEARALTTDPIVRARAAHDLANLVGYGGGFGAGVQILEEATAELGARDRGLALRLAGSWVALSGVHPDGAARVDERRAELLGLAHTEDPDARALQLHLAMVLACRGAGRAPVVELATAGFAGESFVSEEGSESLAAGQGVHALVFVDELVWAREVVECLLADARRRGSMLGFITASGLRALVSLRAGDIDEAEADGRAAVELARAHNLFLVAPFLAAHLSEALVEQGALDEAASLVDAVTLPAELERVVQGAALTAARGNVLHARGDLDGAAAQWRRTGEIVEACRVHNPNVHSWRSNLALAVARDDRAEAIELVEAELRAARAAASRRAVGIALRARGLVNGGSIDDLRASVAELDESPAVLERARSLFELGAALRRANRKVDARVPLGRARELASGCGATALAADSETELRATGARPRRIATTGAAALTASQRRVARLAESGASNPAIAQSLFVTVNTVESHLRAVYLKLGIHSRDDLARALAGEEVANAECEASAEKFTGRP